MPHVIVKLWPGRTEDQKTQLTERITRDVVEAFGVGESSVSVSFQEVDPQEWTEAVYKPDILNGPGKLYKKPGYNPLA
jgi:4-oxalocrotonate tautomerase